jgi:hypothetical protein
MPLFHKNNFSVQGDRYRGGRSEENGDPGKKKKKELYLLV